MAKNFISPDEAFEMIYGAGTSGAQSGSLMSPDEAFVKIYGGGGSPDMAADIETITPKAGHSGAGGAGVGGHPWEGLIPSLIPRNRIERLKEGGLTQKIKENAQRFDPNLPEWSIWKALRGGTADVAGREADVVAMNDEQIRHTAEQDIADVYAGHQLDGGMLGDMPGDMPGAPAASNDTLSTVERAAILRSKSIGDDRLLKGIQKERAALKSGLERAQEAVDPGAYNMPISAGGQLVHDVFRAVPYTTVSAAQQIPLALLTGPAGTGLGAALSAALESQMEQADVYGELRKRGLGHEEAYNASQKVLAANMAMLPLSNYAQTSVATGFGKALASAQAGMPDSVLGKGIAKAISNKSVKKIIESKTGQYLAPIVLDALGEGSEESIQGGISSAALGDPIDRGALAYEGLVGAAMGAMFGGVGAFSERARTGGQVQSNQEWQRIRDRVEADKVANADAAEAKAGSSVSQARVMEAVRKTFNEIRAIPAGERTATDAADLESARRVMEAYSAGEYGRAEAIARDYFDFSELEGDAESEPIAAKERATSELAIPAKPLHPADVGMETFTSIRERFIKDLRRFNAADGESLSASDRHKFAMLSYAANAYQRGDFQRTANILAQLYGKSEKGGVGSEPIIARERATSELAVPTRRINADRAYVGTPRAVSGGYQVEKTDGTRVFVPEALFGDYYQVTPPRNQPVPKSKRVVNGYAVGDVFQNADGGAYWVTKVGTKGLTLTDGAGKSRNVSMGTMAKSKFVRLSPEHRGNVHYSLSPSYYARSPLYGVQGEEVGARFAAAREEADAKRGRSPHENTAGSVLPREEGASLASPEPVVDGAAESENAAEVSYPVGFTYQDRGWGYDKDGRRFDDGVVTKRVTAVSDGQFYVAQDGIGGGNIFDAARLRREVEDSAPARVKAFETERESTAEAAARRDAEGRAKREHESANGFTDGMSGMRRGQVNKALDKRFRYDGRVMSRREFVEVSEGKAGAHVYQGDVRGDYRLYEQEGERGAYTPVTKTEYDYFNYLRRKRAETENTAVQRNIREELPADESVEAAADARNVNVNDGPAAGPDVSDESVARQDGGEGGTELKEYKYYMNARPAGPGAIPKGSVRIDAADRGGRYGAVYYDRELQSKDVSDYELAPGKGDGGTFERRSEFEVVKKSPSKRISEKQRTAAAKRVQERGRGKSNMQGYYIDEEGRQVFTDIGAIFRLSKHVAGLEAADANVTWPAKAVRLFDGVRNDGEEVTLGREDIAEMIERGRRFKGKDIDSSALSKGTYITKVGSSYVSSERLGEVLSILGSDEVSVHTSKPKQTEHGDDSYLSNVYFTSENGEALLAPVRTDAKSRAAVDSYFDRNGSAGNSAETGKGEASLLKEPSEGPRPSTGEDGTPPVIPASGRDGAAQKESEEGTEKLDREYLAAVEAGDMVSAQRMVDETAAAKGYATEAGYRSKHEAPHRDGDGYNANIIDLAKGHGIVPADMWTRPRDYGIGIEEHSEESFGVIRKAVEAARRFVDGKRRGEPEVLVYRAVSSGVKEGSPRNADWVSPSRAYAERHGETVLNGAYRIQKLKAKASELYWNGDSINEWGFDDGKNYAYRNTKNNRKLFDAVVRDEAGEVVPLSKRFDASKKETYYRLGPTAQAQLDADAAAFAKQVDDFVAGKMGWHAEFKVMQTPLVLQISDARVKPLPIVMSQNTLKKIFTKHKLSPNLVKQIPAALADPIMVFESEGRAKQLQNGLVVMLELKDSQGATINVPIALNATHKGAQGQIVCNDIASAYGRLSPLTGKPFNDWFVKQAAAPGRLKYVNTKKYSQWISQSGLVGSGGQSIKSLLNSVKTEADLVKAQSAAPGSYALGEKRAGLPPLSVSEVAARVKGAKVSELSEGKMRLDFENGVSWIVDTQADAIAADPEVVKRDYGREVRPGEAVSGRTRVIDGQRFIDLVAGMSDARTFNHEVFESAWDSLSKEEQAAVLKTHGSRESAAEMYGEFLEGRVGKLTKRTQAIFQRLKDFFSAIRATLFGRNSEDVFREIASGKALNRKAGTVENQEHYRLARRFSAEKGVLPERNVYSDALKEAGMISSTAESVAKMEVPPSIGGQRWLNEDGQKLERVVQPSALSESVRDKAMRIKANFYRQWIDKFDPLKKNFGESIYHMAENAIYGAQSRATRRFEVGDPSKGVKGLLEIFKDVPVNEQEGLSTYAVYKHLFDIASRSEEMEAEARHLTDLASAKRKEIVEDRKLPSPDRESLSDYNKRIAAMKAEHDLYLKQAETLRSLVKQTRGRAEAYATAIQEMESRYPHWISKQQELVRYNQALLEMLNGSGIVSDSLYGYLRKTYPNYVPLQRDFGAESGVEAFAAGNGLVNVTNPLKKMKGSSRDVIDPLNQIVSNTFTYESIVARQKVGAEIMKGYDDGMYRDLIAEVEDRHHGPGEMVFHVWDKGKKRLFKADTDIYEALVPRRSARWEDNPIAWASKAAARTLRAGTTHGLTFGLRNPFRDTFNYSVVGENYRPIVDTVRGFMFAMNHDVGGIYDQFMAHGGAQGMTSLSRDQHSVLMGRLRSDRGTVLVESLKNPAKAVWDLIGAFSELGEQASRLGQFERAMAAGYSAEEAVAIARDNMNFMRSGVIGEVVNQHVPFWNAAVQGTDKMVRTYFKDGHINKSALVRSLLYITLPSMLATFWNYSDDDRRERYLDLPAWRRNTFWNFIVGEKGPVISIPKPFEIGMIFGSLPERIIDYAYANDKRAFDGFKNSLVEALTPEMYPLAPLLIFELSSNYSKFYGRPVVPPREQRLESGLQYGPYTAEWAKFVGRHLDVSPRMLEYAAFGLGGGLAKEVSNVSDEVFRFFSGETRPAKPFYTTAPGLRGFFSTGGGRTEEAFRSELEVLQKKLATAETVYKTQGYSAMTEGQKNIMRQKARIKTIGRLSTAKGGMQDIYRQIREITVMRGIKGDEKMARIEALEERIWLRAKKGLAAIDSMYESLDRR